MTPQLSADFDRIRQRALIIGGVCLLLCAIGWIANPDQFCPQAFLVSDSQTRDGHCRAAQQVQF